MYRTHYTYSGIVSLNDNILRVTPYNGGNQKVISEILEMEPRPYPTRFKDKWVTQCTGQRY